MAKKEMTNCRLNRVGGAAVLEGVMMKAGDRASTACRIEGDKIAVIDKKFVSARKKHKILNLPILRGVVNFIESLTLSFSTLELSAEMMGEGLAEEESKFEKWLTKTFGKSIFDIVMFIADIASEEAKDQEDMDGALDYSLVIAKHRNGMRGTIPIKWKSEFTQFYEPGRDTLYTRNTSKVQKQDDAVLTPVESSDDDDVFKD